MEVHVQTLERWCTDFDMCMEILRLCRYVLRCTNFAIYMELHIFDTCAWRCLDYAVMIYIYIYRHFLFVYSQDGVYSH